MSRHLVLGTLLLLGVGGYHAELFAEDQAALNAFATVQKVFQSPRCQNCHIPGDAPLQFDAGLAQRQRPGLVEGHDIDLGRRFDHGAALHQESAPRPGGHGRSDGGGAGSRSHSG